MDPIKVQYRVTKAITIRREGTYVFVTNEDEGMEIELSLADAFEVGSYLRDVCDDDLVAGGWIGMRGNPYELDRRDYEEEIK